MPPGSGKIAVERRPHMVVNREFGGLLESAGLDGFEALYRYEGGTPVKRIRERRVDRVEIGTGTGRTVCYLKRHRALRPTAAEWAGALLTGRPRSPGMLEFDNIRDFRDKGVPTVNPVAAGERRVGPLLYESFLLTESVRPFMSLEEIIRHHPRRLEGTRGRRQRHRILDAVAKLAGTMHDAGFNHRDFNATHVLVGPEDGTGRPALALFDLQRVDHRRWWRLKWGVKLIAELHYTLPDPLFEDTDRRRLFMNYHGIETMAWRHRFLWLWIRGKTRRIGRHTEKLARRRGEKGPADL